MMNTEISIKSLFSLFDQILSKPEIKTETHSEFIHKTLPQLSLSEFNLQTFFLLRKIEASSDKLFKSPPLSLLIQKIQNLIQPQLKLTPSVLYHWTQLWDKNQSESNVKNQWIKKLISLSTVKFTILQNCLAGDWLGLRIRANQLICQPDVIETTEYFTALSQIILADHPQHISLKSHIQEFTKILKMIYPKKNERVNPQKIANYIVTQIKNLNILQSCYLPFGQIKSSPYTRDFGFQGLIEVVRSTKTNYSLKVLIAIEDSILPLSKSLSKIQPGCQWNKLKIEQLSESLWQTVVIEPQLIPRLKYFGHHQKQAFNIRQLLLTIDRLLSVNQRPLKNKPEKIHFKSLNLREIKPKRWAAKILDALNLITFSFFKDEVDYKLFKIEFSLLALTHLYCSIAMGLQEINYESYELAYKAERKIL